MPKNKRPAPPENHCVDFNELLRTCNITKMSCDHPDCDIYSATPRRQKAPPAPPKAEPLQPRNFVDEMKQEAEKMGTKLEPYSPPNEMPEDF